MTAPPRHRLGVDLGTSTTIAMLQWPDGRVRPLLFDGSPLLSSAVLLGADGQLHTGRDAAHLGRGNPERLEPNPKRRIDDDVVLLGTSEVPVRALLHAVLGRVAVEAHRVAGHIGDLTLTHPAAWGSRRCAQLIEAAERAGLGRGRLVPEPVAAATYFARTMADRFPPGSRVIVYDLGAGTCDITVLRRGPLGFDIVASDGLNDVGGLDVDAAIVAFLEATYGRLWTDAVSRRQVWEEVRTAKEMLSRTSGTVIAIPSLAKEVPLGREQFDGLIGPVLRPTIALAKSLMRDTAAAAAPGAPTAWVLVGGASRIPLVATLLTEATGIAPIVIEQPELVVAEGALHLASGGGPATPVPVSGGGRHGPATTAGFGPGATGTAAPVSGPGGPAVPVSGVSGPAGPVSGGFNPVSGAPWVSGEFTPARGAPASGPMTSGPAASRGGFAPGGVAHPGGLAPGGFAAPGGLAPGGFAAPGGLAPGGPPSTRRPARRGGLAIAAAIVAALVLLAGAGVTGVVLLTNNEKKGPGTNRTTGANGPTGGNGPNNGGSTAMKYPMTALPENLCSKVDLGRLATSYEKENQSPSYTRTVNSFLSNATCSLSRLHGYDSLIVSVSAMVYADTGQAESAQRQTHDTAKANDTGMIELTGVGEQAHAARTTTTSSNLVLIYTIEARDANLRITLYGTATRIDGQAWNDQDRRQFVDDLAAVVRSTIAGMGSG